MSSDFSNSKVKEVSVFLQNYMKKNKTEFMVPDECAELLAEHDILPNDIGPKQGFNFRQMLRDGRDEKITLVTGARQEPNRRWFIDRV